MAVGVARVFQLTGKIASGYPFHCPSSKIISEPINARLLLYMSPDVVNEHLNVRGIDHVLIPSRTECLEIFLNMDLFAIRQLQLDLEVTAGGFDAHPCLVGADSCNVHPGQTRWRPTDCLPKSPQSGLQVSPIAHHYSETGIAHVANTAKVVDEAFSLPLISCRENVFELIDD